MGKMIFNTYQRRHLEKAAVSALILLGIFCTWTASALQHDKGYGEPYILSGNRLVFTTWYFVQPGKPDWRDSAHNSVYAKQEARLKAGEAFFHYDDYPWGIEFVVEKPERLGPVIKREKPWERMGLAPGPLLLDNGIYRLWAISQDEEGTTYSCYFESADGMNWQRPNLGLVEYRGNTDNNLYPGCPGFIFIDPSAPPEGRYKAVTLKDFENIERFEKDYKERRPYSIMATETDPGRVHSIYGSVSPDGFHWTTLADPLSVEISDTDITAYYDTSLKKYVMYTRSYTVGARAPQYSIETHQRRNQFTARRAIGRSESATFNEFPLSETIIEPGPDMRPTDSYYTNCRTTIPGAPDNHLMFPAVYHLSSDTTSIELHTSYDGKVWHKMRGGSLADTGTDGQWDGGCIFARANLVELPDGDWVLPYVGYVFPHKYPRGAWAYDVGMMRWPKGRLVALEAQDKGEFTTVAFLAPGEKIKVNATTKRAGGISVEACDFNAKPIEGRSFADAIELSGDLFQTPVLWKKRIDTLGIKKNEPVVLRFRMNQTKLYGVDFE